MDEVNEQTLNVRAVVVLIGHDEKVAVSQVLRVLVLHAVAQAQNLADVLDLLVRHDLAVLRLAHVQRLTLQRKREKDRDTERERMNVVRLKREAWCRRQQEQDRKTGTSGDNKEI